MNLRKDHCRNLPSRTTRELVSKRGGEGPCGSLSPLSRGGCAALARPTLPGVQTNTGANCAKEIERESASPSPRKRCARAASSSSNMSKRLSATDISALASMKNVAKCDTWCELQNPVNHRVFERKLRPKPLGRGHACLGVTRRCPPHLLLRDCGGADDGLPCASPRGWHKYQVLGDARHDNRWLRNLGCPSCAFVAHRGLEKMLGSGSAFNATPGQAGLPAEFKHINKRRKRNLQGFP